MHKLQNKLFDPHEIELVLAEFVASGLLNDRHFVEHFIHYRTNKGYGPLRIQAELKQRGIAEDLIEEEMQITDNKWQQHARMAWQKRFKNCLPHNLKTRAQQMRFLQQRGFTHEQINSIFKSEE